MAFSKRYLGRYLRHRMNIRHEACGEQAAHQIWILLLLENNQIGRREILHL